MKPHEFDRVVNKFGMQTRDGKDRLAFLYVDGRPVVRTKRSHGSKPVLVNHVRQQLKLTEDELREAVQCSLTRDGYIALLREKGVL